MYCKYCGNEISDEAAFCNKCGKKMILTERGQEVHPANINDVPKIEPISISKKEKKTSKSKLKKTLLAIAVSIVFVIALANVARLYIKYNAISILAKAAKNNNVFMLNTLLLFDIDINTIFRYQLPDEVTAYEKTALDLAAIYNSTDVMKTLIKAGAYVDDLPPWLHVDNPPINAESVYWIYKDQKPLILAVQHRNIDAIKILIENGADVNIKRSVGFGSSPIHCAVSDITCLQILVESGADVNLKDYNDETPLMRAAMFGYENSTKFLIKNGADINAKDKSGETALHHAAAMGKIETVRILLEKGADVYIVDNDGHTALTEATLYGNFQDVANLIKQYRRRR